MSARRTFALAALALAASCAAPPRWQDDLPQALSSTRRAGRELVVFFALPGREMSDRMQARLDDPVVIAALARGGFAAVVCDGVERKRLYGAWIGGGEGMGVAVIDAAGQCYCARPGPQDPEQLAALLDLCARERSALADLRRRQAAAPRNPLLQHELGCLYLLLGCRVHSEPLLLEAATAGVAEARHRLARLYALDGNVTAARRWLPAAPRTPAAMATEGYVLFKERRHAEAVEVFEEALATGRLGAERQRAELYLGKSLHEDKQDERAVPILERLANEGTGSTFEAAARSLSTFSRSWTSLPYFLAKLGSTGLKAPFEARSSRLSSAVGLGFMPLIETGRSSLPDLSKATNSGAFLPNRSLSAGSALMSICPQWNSRSLIPSSSPRTSARNSADSNVRTGRSSSAPSCR